jgi:hypothetical protein
VLHLTSPILRYDLLPAASTNEISGPKVGQQKALRNEAFPKGFLFGCGGKI